MTVLASEYYPIACRTRLQEQGLLEIYKFIFIYIWGEMKKSKVRRNVLIKDYQDGGLKAPEEQNMEMSSTKIAYSRRKVAIGNNHWKKWVV